jgi:hypothetical protein
MCVQLLLASRRRAYVKKQLKLSDRRWTRKLLEEERKRVWRFTNVFLSYDSVLALRVLESSACSQFSCEVVQRLYAKFEPLDQEDYPSGNLIFSRTSSANSSPVAAESARPLRVDGAAAFPDDPARSPPR